MLFLIAPSAFAKTTAHIPYENAQSSGALVLFPAGEFHVQNGVFPSATDIVVHDLGKIDSAQLPRHYRSRNHLFQYSFSQAPTKDIVVRLYYRSGTSDQKQKQIFYQTNDGAPWQKLRTVTNKSAHYAQAVVTEETGNIIVAKNRRKFETPIANTNFVQYPGLPHSDTGAVIDAKSGAFLYREEASKQRHIASITKLATTLVFLESQPNLDRTVSYTTAYDHIGSEIALENGDQLTLQQVLYSTLIPSANNMAETLANSTPMSRNAFMQQVNTRMQELGLHRTHFVEPTGLDAADISTAGNIARLANMVFHQYPDIYGTAANTSKYTFTLANSGRVIEEFSTNYFDGRGLYDVVGFKTGYYPGSADRTLVIDLKEKTTGHEIVLCLLGNPEYGTIFDEVYGLAQWTFANWTFQNY
ncbi:MAG: D-alanyl-D-alanine carboxypeptidase [Candidatus Kerfeldbacteria bacterium]|nr:D-alanyl-D-alanine carboxypeptidase [Candidatus Kerfeldbacteria bacterium]